MQELPLLKISDDNLNEDSVVDTIIAKFNGLFNPLTPNRRHWRRPKMSLVRRIDVNDDVRKK